MKIHRYAILLAVAMVGCTKPGTPTSIEGALPGADFKVQRLFAKDGCTIYRFRDGGHDHYFTSCGEAIGGQHRSCGKGCTQRYDENIREN